MGVVKDFHFNNLYEKIQPMVFTNRGGNQIFVKVNTRDLNLLLSQIEQFTEEITGTTEFEYEFLDQHFERHYQAELDKRNLFSLFSVLAIIIAALGLFAVSANMILSKAKETSIRKVFGSSTSNLVLRYSMNSIRNAIIGFAVSIPFIHYYLQFWLSSFAYKTSIGISVYLITFTTIFFVSFLTVLFNSVRAAEINPIEALRVQG